MRLPSSTLSGCKSNEDPGAADDPLLMAVDEEDSTAPSASGHGMSAEDGGRPAKRIRLEPSQAAGLLLPPFRMISRPAQQ